MLTRYHWYVNSLHNFNEMSVRQVLRMKKIISLRGVILLYHQLLITTNKELSGTSWENERMDLGSERFKPLK